MASAPTEKDDTKAMPPPPPPETKILQPEFSALTRCLKDAIVKTGQVYSFYADARRLGIANHVSRPPRSLTAALGRDIEQYDQLCDSIEAHLVRAISVLKRDLRREEKRKEDEERQKNLAVAMLPPPVPPTPVEIIPEESASHISNDAENPITKSPPIVNSLGRRPSAISISSLHRPQFPLKLDLSSSALRITEEEAAMFQKPPTSPVTLVPKSARPVGPNEFPPDFLAAFAPVPNDAVHSSSTIDLTMPDGMHLSQDQHSMPGGVGLGDSSEKPIELDLDSMDIEMANMTDLFGDPTDGGDDNDTHDGLFSPALGQGDQEGENSQKTQDNVLVDFQMDPSVNDELFGNFSPNAEGGDIPGKLSVPSPGTLLAQFSSSSNLMDAQPSVSSNPAPPGTGESFDLDSIDLSQLEPDFFGNTEDTGMNFPMEMEAFLDIDSTPQDKKE